MNAECRVALHHQRVGQRQIEWRAGISEDGEEGVERHHAEKSGEQIHKLRYASILKCDSERNQQQECTDGGRRRAEFKKHTVPDQKREGRDGCPRNDQQLDLHIA